MTEDQELEGWRSDWSSVAAAAPPEELVSHVRKRAKRQLRDAVGEALASLFVVATSAYFVVRHPIAPLVAFAMAMCLYVGVWLTYFFMIRIGSWGAAGATVRDYLARSRRLHDIELRWARFARACMIVLAIFLLGWSPWLVLNKWELYRQAPWRGVVGFGIAACILALVWMSNRRKLQALVAERARFAEQTHALEE